MQQQKNNHSDQKELDVSVRLPAMKTKHDLISMDILVVDVQFCLGHSVA